MHPAQMAVVAQLYAAHADEDARTTPTTQPDPADSHLPWLEPQPRFTPDTAATPRALISRLEKLDDHGRPTKTQNGLSPKEEPAARDPDRANPAPTL